MKSVRYLWDILLYITISQFIHGEVIDITKKNLNTVGTGNNYCISES